MVAQVDSATGRAHCSAVVSAAFDEPNPIADAGLMPLVRLAER
jgi:hypothetical protein